MKVTVYRYSFLDNIFYILIIPVTIETSIFSDGENTTTSFLPYGYTFKYDINLSNTKFKLEGYLGTIVILKTRKIMTYVKSTQL